MEPQRGFRGGGWAGWGREVPIRWLVNPFNFGEAKHKNLTKVVNVMAEI